MDARLAKVRQRKLQKQGLSESTTEASSLDEKNISFEQNKHLSHLGNEKDKQGDTQEYDIEKLITEARLATVDNKEPPPSSSGKESTLERFQAKRPKRGKKYQNLINLFIAATIKNPNIYHIIPLSHISISTWIFLFVALALTGMLSKV